MAVKNRIAVKSFLWLLILLYFQSLQAQSYITGIQKLSVEDGLSNRFVNKIYKGSQGFIWIGTQYGLNRYDGYEFKRYTSENSTLVSNNIKNILEDKDQKLWVIHGSPYVPYRLKHIDILDIHTGHIQSFEDFFKDRVPFSDTDIRDMYLNPGKEIWISTSKGIIYRYANNRFERIFSTPEQKFLKIFHADDQYIWLYGKALLKVDMQGRIIKKTLFQDDVKNVGVDKNNNLWLFQPLQKRLLQINNDEERPQAVSLKPMGLDKKRYNSGYFRMQYINPANDLIWWHEKDSTGAFLVFHPREGIVFNLKNKIEEYTTHGDPQITDIYFDSGERAWVGTEDGILIITLKKSKFRKLLSGKSKSYSTRGIISDNSGTIYINSYNGRAKINSYKNSIKYKGEEIGGYWLGAARDSQDNLWFSDSKRTIEKYNPSTQKRKYYTYAADQPWPPSSQWTIIRDKTGRVWTGTGEGLYYLDPKTEVYQKFNNYNVFPQLRESIIYHLYEDKKGIWIGSSSGMYLLEPGKGITARYAVSEKTPYHIPYDHILHFYRDTTGIFWLATKGGGLIRFNPENGSYRQFTIAEGLSNNTINAVYEDEYGKLWLPSNYGLMQFNKENFRVNTYLKGDGITHEEFNVGSHYGSDEGLLYFGGLSGVTIVDPEDFTEENLTPAPLHLTYCQVLNGKTGALTDKTRTVLESGRLVLSPSDKSFVIQFALLNYENSEQNSYAYKIKGLDKAWTTIAENSLRINALPYGNYELQIKGQGIKGQLSANELAIAIVVNKPFYLENSFIISCILALGLLIYIIFRWRLQNLKKVKVQLEETVKQRTGEISHQKNKIERQAKKLRELDNAKSRFFANISHELRTPLTLVLGYLENILQKHDNTTIKDVRPDLAISKQNGHRLLTLTEEILELSKLESGQLKIHEKPVAFYPFISRLSDPYRSFVSQKQITITVSFNLPYDIVLKIDEGKFEKIINNLLSNAIKFTSPGDSIHIEITALKTTTGINTPKFQLKVSDTGKGIYPEDLPYIFNRFYQSGQKDALTEGGTGIGLALARELTALINGTLTAESSLGKGSTFTFCFPATIIAPGTAMPPADHNRSAKSIPAKEQLLKEPQANQININHENTTQKPAALLVEDHPEMRKFIRNTLDPHYHVTEAVDGMHALEILHHQKPDIIVSDVMMPRLDGFGLLKKIREEENWKELPLIILTARAADEDKHKAFQIGVDDYLIKPFQPSELIARMRNLVKNHLLRKQLAKQVHNIKEKETLPDFDREFVQRATAIVNNEMANARFGVIDMAEALHISQRQLSRKMQRTTGLSPLHFIREIRLQKARTLLENKEKETVAEVMYAVGIQSTGHFARIYYERFGKKPSAYTS